jgi:acyl-CoA reductase-like NAD-dependent aldehyde dehydrogenase
LDDLVCISPVDGREYARRALTSPAQVGEALDRARRAQRDWAQVPLEERCAVAARFLQAMERLDPGIVPELAWQMGRPVRYQGELRSLVERVQGMISDAADALAPVVIGEGREVARIPAGLVLVIAPWNYPFLTAANTIIPALIAGNAVLLKHAAQTLKVGERFAQALKMAGLPEGLFHNLFLSHDATAGLLQSGSVNHATFTGSVEGGRAIERAAAGSFTTLTLELGGKDPAFVRKMPIYQARSKASSTAVSTIAASHAAVSSGSMCTRRCGSRSWTASSKRRTNTGSAIRSTRTPVWDPCRAHSWRGRCASRSGRAVEAGAQTHVERQLFPADKEGSAYLMPQVLTGVDHSMSIMSEETFGPAIGLMPVKSDQEAVRLMNDSHLGLTASSGRATWMWASGSRRRWRQAPSL